MSHVSLLSVWTFVFRTRKGQCVTKSYKSRSVCFLWILWERMCCPCSQFFTLWPHNFNLHVTILSRPNFSLGTLTILNKGPMCDFGALASYFFLSQPLGMFLLCIYTVKLRRKTIFSFSIRYFFACTILNKDGTTSTFQCWNFIWFGSVSFVGIGLAYHCFC